MQTPARRDEKGVSAEHTVPKRLRNESHAIRQHANPFPLVIVSFATTFESFFHVTFVNRHRFI